MANDKITKKWEDAWKQEVHTTDYALKRIKSAKSAKLTPVKIDTTDYYGYFQGSRGKYETFLDFCPCGDFRRNKLPCKHIYRLAIELGLLDIKADYDTNEMIPEDDIDVLYKVLVKFVPEVLPEPDEIQALEEGRKDRLENGTIPHEAINWD